MFRLFFLTVLLGLPAISLGWWWWADRVVRRWPVGRSRKWWRAVIAVHSLLFVVGFAWFVGGRLLGWSARPHTLLTGYVMLWGLIVLPFVAAPLMLLWTAWRGARRVVVRAKPESAEPTMSRRELLGAALVAAPLMLTLGGTVASIPQRRRFRIRHLTVDLPQLPAQLDGMTIAHVSDSHVGKFTHGAVLEHIADATNRLEADLVLFTGDLIDYTLDDLPEALTMLRRFDRRRGLFAIEGNHDLFEGREAFEQGVRNDGHTLLLDESATAYVRGHPVQLLGIRWQQPGQTAQPSVDRVAALRDPDAFPILLAHHPHAFDAAVAHGLPLTLAGHTHGGQLMLTPDIGFGPALFRYWSGLYRQGDSQLVVSNGVGNWFPLRTSAPAEIVHLTLRRV